MKTKVLVSGSAGFIGHWLTRGLLKKGYHVIGLDNFVSGLQEYAKEPNEFIKMSVWQMGAEQLRDVKYVFHLAALPRVIDSWKNPEQTNNINVTGTVRLLECARQAGVEKVIYSSSSSVYGNNKVPWVETQCPDTLSPYAIQKLAAEHYCEVYRTTKRVKTASLRYFNVFGEEQPSDNPYTGVLTLFLDRRQKGLPLAITGDGEQRRDFTYVQDVVSANILAAESQMEGVYNVGTGKNYSINEVADMVGGGKRYVEPREGEPRESLADITRIESFGWKPETSIKEWISTQ